MGRPRTSFTLKDGYYIEVNSKSSSNGIKICRDSKEEVERLMARYESTKEVNYLGEVKDGKFIG